MIGFVNGLLCAPVMKLYPDYQDYFFETPGMHEFTVPNGAKTFELTVIGGGAGGQEGGVSYGVIASAWPAGGAGGATGEMHHAKSIQASPGTVYAVKVGKGGNSFGGAGGASYFGNMLSAAGGSSGNVGGNEPLVENATANGGDGGSGGIGGNGGGRGRGMYSQDVGINGSNGASTLAWETWDKPDWYVFGDAATKRRLGQGGRGGDGMDMGTLSTRSARGRAVESGDTCYGGGGRGGDQQKNGTVKTPTAGQNGLVAVRVWYKAR